MARSINSPGVQIIETDLSNYQQIVGGTTVFVPGFAPQGPTDETILVTSVSELDQIYGTPTTAAERYFYHTSRQVLNSPATLLTTRLPYGSGSGEGFADQYSALIFPILSADNTFYVYPPTYKTLSEDDYTNLVQNNFKWDAVGTAVLASTQALSASKKVATNVSQLIQTPNLTALGPTSNDKAVYLNVLYPTAPANTAVYSPLNNETWVKSTSAPESWIKTNFETNLNGNYNITNKNVAGGLVIINKSQTAANEVLEGYYLSITDNAEWGPDTNFTAVNQFYGLSGANPTDASLYEVPSTRFNFALSGLKDVPGSNSISELIERRYDYSVGSTFYNDALIINVFKLRKSIYEPQQLAISFSESFIGSLDSNKDTLAANSGLKKLFLENVVNNSSNNLQVLVNPNISRLTNWASASGLDVPKYNVRTVSSTKAIFPNSVFLPTYQITESKNVGNVRAKIERALTLVESPESILVDVVVDAGLSTITTNTVLLSSGVFDDTAFVNTAGLTNINHDKTVETYRSVINTFANFVQNTRQDCVFIADPLRQIFVNGENLKTIDQRTKTFSQDIYKPLRTSFETINNNYVATYGNWAKAYDQYSDKNVWLPFSGFAAAVYARTDTFAQPWIAPAGLTRGLIPNIVDLAFNPNQKQRDFLYTISINPVVFFPGDGFVIFGQKTMQTKPSAFDRVNVRRLFLTLERATQRALKYFVFEPNTEFTRTRLKNTISPIFELAKNTEGLYDYLIVCDERNNTGDVIDRNELVVDIYIKPVKAAEFILVNFIATRTGQNFQELL